MEDFNLEMELGISEEKQISSKSFSVKTQNKHFARRFSSEKQIEKIIPFEFNEGDCYHVLSQGDIDFMTFTRMICRAQKIEWAIASTWVMAMSDALEFEHFIEIGRIKNLCFYGGEHIRNYSDVWRKMITICNQTGGRAAYFYNHSKVFVGAGDRFNFLIESSANFNTNPRCENTIITIDREIVFPYRDFFDGIKSHDDSFNDWSRD